MEKISDKEKLTDIQKFCINPLVLEILGINEFQLYRTYRGFGEEFKFSKNDKLYSIKMSLDNGIYDNRVNYIELEQHLGDSINSMSIHLIRLDNISTIDHLRKFKKLMDVYFSDYVIREEIKVH